MSLPFSRLKSPSSQPFFIAEGLCWSLSSICPHLSCSGENWNCHSRCSLTSNEVEGKDHLPPPSGNALSIMQPKIPLTLFVTRPRCLIMFKLPSTRTYRSFSVELLFSSVAPSKQCHLLKSNCLHWEPRTMPLSFVDCSKWSRSYPLSNCDLPIWYFPIITWISSTKGFLYIFTQIIKRKKEEKTTINACQNTSFIKDSVSKLHAIKIFFLQILQATFQIRYIQNLSIIVYK